MDISLASVFTVAAIIDWGQTRNIVNNSDEICSYYDGRKYNCNSPYYEKNVFLGKKPRIGQVDSYFPVYIVGALGVADILPSKYRKPLLMLLSGIQIDAINKNAKIGLRIDF